MLQQILNWFYGLISNIWFWIFLMIILSGIWIIKNIKKEKESPYYKDNYGKFQSVIILLILSLVLLLLIWNFNWIDNWLQILVNNIWFWVILVSIILIIFISRFIKKDQKLIPSLKWSWSWLWWLLVIPLFFLAKWFYTEYIVNFNSEITVVQHQNTSIVPSYQRFDVNSSTHVTAGSWYILEGDEPLMSFVAEDGGKLDYYIVMVGHETRDWSRQTHTSQNGDIEDIATSKLQPYDWAKHGPARVKFSRSCIVVVK